MSENQSDQGTPILRGTPLARALDNYTVPGLSAEFADRVLAAAEVRPDPLPELRRAARGPRRWRLGQRMVIGLASFGALATAAAATGLLQQFDIPVPSAGTVWASLTGKPVAAPSPKVAEVSNVPAVAPSAASTEVAISGPIDTPEELGEAFRRIDEVRENRRELRRERIDQRIDGVIERRRNAGLPVPTPEQEARLRERIDAAQARREQLADQRIGARRETMQRKVENGEALTREDLTGRPPLDPSLRDRIGEIRQLPPEQRREAWRRLPPEERRALAEQVRARRADAAVAKATSAEPSSESSPAEQENRD
ncbi:MAG: hypothetical protein ACKO1N_01275 [Erythrobacter sp.]